MEHAKLIRDAVETSGIALDDRKIHSLALFADSVYYSNRLFNLTGHDSLEDIVRDLIISSIEPFKDLNVPRGTVFCDLGSGAGVPGIPLSILRNDLRGFLIESSVKKTGFISEVCVKMGLENVSVINARAEDVGKEERFREFFGFAVSRAMGAPYVVIEMGAPLVAAGGFLYIYSSLEMENLHPDVIAHAEKLGMAGVGSGNHKNFGIGETGLLFIKKDHTDRKFPRRYPVISREADKIR